MKLLLVCLICIVGPVLCLRYGYVSTCIEPGLKCESCSKLIFCVGNGGDTNLQKIDLKTCNNTQGQYCSVGHGGCATDHRVCDIFGMQDINCQDEGLFPDPFDCTSYHNCISDQNGGFKDFRYSCRLGLAYDPLSTICRLKRSDRVCTESPVPKCEKPLQMGALIENPTIYYICVDSGEGLYPRLYRCSNGLMFDAINAQCVESLPTTTPKPKLIGLRIHPRLNSRYQLL
ncbi:hypothetical protein M8J76_014185 [Diaphorina citri]|nr:hypothetical protein M8J75_016034 [Diaphorina citri]KAI5745790.1 hypothetical protein M8J76_014185 [Diaphorina citri]KAI5753176.1 hypothetical protein M8J77_024303 [Diaphorina citri]